MTNEIVPSESIIDVAIIGGGPAGLTAALYAARGLARTVVFEQEACGGQIAKTDHVENYPGFPEGISGFELGDLFAKQAEEHGAELRPFTPVESLKHRDDGTFEVIAGGESVIAKSVVVATGSTPRKLEIPGEKEYTGRGVSWCATCDAAFFRDKRVAVIGGGNAAVEEALFLTKFATEVHLVHRRDEFRAAQVLVERAKAHDKITMHLSQVPVEIVGTDGRVSGIRLESQIDSSEITLPIDGVFLFVGTNPISEIVEGMIETDERGYIPKGAMGETSLPGLFVAGDISATPLKQVVTAAGEGAQAGQAVLHYLEELKNAQ